MIERIGPKIWDRIGPGMAAAYWDDSAKKIDGALCYSAIEKAASVSAWACLVQAIVLTPFGALGAMAAVSDASVWKDGWATLGVGIVLLVTGLSYFNLLGCIRWTQLPGTMAADGVCDDLFVGDDEEEGEEGDDAEDEDEPEESNVIPLQDDEEWGSAS